jgi:hypothetical protein
MSSQAWRFIGFDARESELDGRKAPIPVQVREAFLLRPEVELPYSVDRHVWPSVWSMSDEPQTDGSGLWLNLARLQESLIGHERTAILIGIELLVPNDPPSFGFPYSLIDSTPEPRSVPEGSTYLGFDVADAGFLSGLSNCGYSEAERAELRPKWQDRINDFGLLKSEQGALEFRELSDVRAPEHAPFWVFRLSRLPDL